MRRQSLPERQVGHASHRRERERRRELEGTDPHWRAVLIWLAQRTPPSDGRQMSSSNPTASDPGSTMRMSASARWPGSSSFCVPAAGQVVGRADVALAQRAAEAVLERQAQERQRLRIARPVDDARAQHQPVRLARVAGGAPLAQFVGGEVRRREDRQPEEVIGARERRTKGRVAHEVVAPCVHHLQREEQGEDRDTRHPGPALRQQAG